MQQVSSILVAARPKLQKWISDAETDDPESLGEIYDRSLTAVELNFASSSQDTFLQINDQINTVLTRYEAFKKGDYSTARNPIPPEIGSSSGGGGGLSLIDLDDCEPVNAGAATFFAPTNDLSGLFVTGPSAQQTFQTGMNIPMQRQPTSSLAQQPLSQPSQPQTFSPTPVFANGGFSGSSMAALQQVSQTSTPPASIMLPSTPGSQRGTPVPTMQSSSSYFGKATQQVGTAFGSGMGFGSNGSNGSRMGSGVYGTTQLSGSGWSGLSQQARPSGLEPQQAQQAAVPTSDSANTQQIKDPFADLAGLF